MDPRVKQKLAVAAADLGRNVRDERERRRLTTRAVGEIAGISPSAVSNVEAGRVASLETYVRLALALHLRPEFDLVSGRRTLKRAEDPVHAAMSEVLAERLRANGAEVRIDEPYQHFQFAGRGDVVAWRRDPPAFAHFENRTRFPNIQEAAGAFASKRAFLGDCLARRFGVRTWLAEVHVIVALWSAEVLHSLRLHRATFRSTCPDPPDAFAAWWEGRPTPRGEQTTLVLFDPIEGRRADRRRWVGLHEALGPNLKPRYRDYGDALDALKRAGRA